MISPLPLPPLFQNGEFIAVDKPAGWLSVPSRLGADDARPCLGTALSAALGARLWPVHRLDLEVTGLILFAKSAAAHSAANGWFEQRLVTKTYEAWSDGDFASAPRAPCVWHSTILRGKKRAYESPHGKPSETLAHALAALPAPLSGILWQLHPKTGRSHQLRFDLARHGFPILGDQLYGSKQIFGGDDVGQIALRCRSLDFSACKDAAIFQLPRELTAAPLVAPSSKGPA